MLKATPLRILLSLLLGTAVGYLCSKSHGWLPSKVPAVAALIGSLFLNGIRLCIVPLVTSRLIASCARSGDANALGRVARRSLAVVLGMLVASALFASAVAIPIFRHFGPAMAHPIAPVLLHGATRGSASPDSGIADWFASLLPANIVKAAADGSLLPLIVFAIAFGFAISRLQPDTRIPLERFFTALGDAFTLLLAGILRGTPIAVLCLSIGLAGVVGSRGAGALLLYVTVLCLVCLGFVFLVLYPCVLLRGGFPLRSFAEAALPAQTLAFTSRSSLAALPEIYTAARDRIGVSATTVEFFLPFAASLFRVGGCIGQVIGISFLAAFYGVTLAPYQVGSLILNAILVSFTVPGVPGAGILVMAPVLASLGIPLEGTAMLLAIDTLPDMFRTATNVTGWLTACMLVADGEEMSQSTSGLSGTLG